MTTIVYHGLEKTFAMDSMVTWTSGSKQHRVENSYKIEDLTPADIVSTEGERLIAMGFCGSVPLFERAADYVLNNLHEWEERYKTIVDAGGTMFANGACRILLITDKHTYSISFGHQVKVKTHKSTAFVAAGSGAAMADTAHFVYGAKAVDALRAAALIDNASGFMIHSLSIVDGKLVPNAPVYMTDPKTEVMAMRKRAGKSTAFDLIKTTADFAKRYQQEDEGRTEKLAKVRKVQNELRQKKLADEKAKGKQVKKTSAPTKATPTKPVRTRGKAGPLPAQP